ncbi:dynamin family protein [Rhodoferax sp. 4810]|uniref:Dynamin family protein n=1 Tax=Thiospirillum jenense TaxID=1653858 RepID=A0A839HJZ5_9GAMM|nr:dynamin family protein [Thiospirillum jenense]MBB1077311.1 dynamin family protein [Rhodoferax jenense]MBB1127078.1 dynamin family protein [Thiospirillum jenense]
MSSPTTNTAIVYRTLRTFSNHMQRTATPPDGLLSARVIGEFSAGKTRLLRELLGDVIPPPLFPVSSLECQTRLPLEITFAPTPALTLIQRANDYDTAAPIKLLTQFPVREELADYDPQHHRLQLTIPDQHLFLPDGDHYEDNNDPKRLLLIDMPGWNSGDDALADSAAIDLMAGYHNLALVFVVNANRLDGSANSERLREFLDTFSTADFVGRPTLIIVITHCPRPDQERLNNRLRERVLTLWQNELDQDAAQLDLQVLPVEFSELTPDELTQFRTTFWAHLLAPLANDATPINPAAHPWLAQLNRWPSEWDVRPQLIQAQTVLTAARELLTHARINNDFLPGMNMHRLIGLDAVAIQNKLRTQWLRQLKCQTQQQLTDRLAALTLLPTDHPLTAWWNEYWYANVERVLAQVRAFFQQADVAFQQVQTNTPDLHVHLAKHLHEPYQTALRLLDSSFTALVNTAPALADEPQCSRATATLLNLSLLEARYADYYQQARGG